MKWDITDDTRGQAFSLDVLLALVVVVVVIGVSASAVDLVSYKIQDYSSEHSFERVTGDTADILIKTPGSPADWESYDCGDSVTPGLAEVDAETCSTMPNTLSMGKISKLSSNYENLMGNILPNGTDSRMAIYPVDTSLPPVVIHNKTHHAASEIAVANRTVLCDYRCMTAFVSINCCDPSGDVQAGHGWEICPHEHERPDFKTGKPGWICRQFTVKSQDLNFTDFYVLSTSVSAYGSGWIIDSPGDMSSDKQNFASGPVNVNARISELLGNNTKAFLWFHVDTGDDLKPFDAYVLAVPKGTPPSKVSKDYLKPQPAFFILEVWI